ncbi:hypothetical protein EYS09_26215 [Streptomyces kasugaensis]|uniref:Uncharacterized protein n=1 Tax=Streptomyces kasugaensis TaxID=1946 RepID=A0A4Q9HPF4_STRKA|nr:hypothetical protein [Streptomyces kasugaensis]TBO56772.1 hypothetical protein EYS09_26215 [Streptomyces kasugaensis]
MGCNCGGRSGGHVTRNADGTVHSVWRHTDPHGGKVDYASENGARIALDARGGKVEQVDPRTGAVLRTA